MTGDTTRSPGRIVVATLALSLTITGAGCGTSAKLPGAAGSAGGSTSANQSVAGPTLGYVWDSTASAVRIVAGVSTAASLDRALYTGVYQAGYISQLKRYALLINKQGEIYLVTLPGGEPRKISDQLSARQQVALSPTGNQALVYGTDLSSLTWIQGLPNNPNLVTINLPGSTTANRAAVSDSGLALIAGTQVDGSSRVQSVTPTGSTANILTTGQLGGLAFLPRSTSALIADASQNNVLLASGLDGSASMSLIAGAADGIAQPAAVAASADARWAVVANRQNLTVTRIDLTHQAPTAQVQCDCSPTILSPLLGNSTFLVTPLDAGSVSLFNGEGVKPRLLFLAGVQPGSKQGMMR
jgi:hypothetical protein